MKIKFRDGREIEFKKYGKIWLAESVIWEGTELHGSLDELRELKTKISRWFAENAPEKIHDRFKARLPLWSEIKALPFKDQIAYREGGTDKIVDYFLGDADHAHPVSGTVHLFEDYFGWFYHFTIYDWSDTFAIRLCLEERK